MPLAQSQPDPVQAVPRILRFCEFCQKETPHEIRTGSGIIARICLPCLERDLMYELDRD